MKLNLNVGDSVIVKQGVMEPDYEEFELSNWQGRIVDINTKSDANNILITIEWDSLTLEQIPASYIEISEIEGFDWKTMILYDSDLILSKPRDLKEEVKKMHDKLMDIHYWDSLGDEGARISKILGTVNPHDEMKSLQKWVNHLDAELTFPIHAIVSDSEDDWLIKTGDNVLLKSLPHIVDLYGVIAAIMLNGKKYEFPLCNLEVIDKALKDYQLIEDYKTWFANR